MSMPARPCDRRTGATASRGAMATLCALAALGAAVLLDQRASAAELEPFQASYLWIWHGAEIALTRLDLAHQGDTWVYSSVNEPRGLGHLYPMRPRLQSSMRIGPQGVQPLSFQATGSGSAHDADVRFDWDGARATGTYEGTTLDLPIKPGVQDDLSVQIALLVQLQQGKNPQRALEIDKNSVREYDYTREGQETLDTPLGRIDTIIYSSHHPGSPRTTRFWCAPSEGYIPLQVQQQLNNKVEWTMKIQSLTPSAK